jgi:hypothetical protein
MYEVVKTTMALTVTDMLQLAGFWIDNACCPLDAPVRGAYLH